MRINARLDHVRERKLREIRSLTGLTTSEVVKHGLDLVHSEQVGEPKARLKSLLSSSFIGCAAGPADLATDYKRHLTDELDRKHGTG